MFIDRDYCLDSEAIVVGSEQRNVDCKQYSVTSLDLAELEASCVLCVAGRVALPVLF